MQEMLVLVDRMLAEVTLNIAPHGHHRIVFGPRELDKIKHDRHVRRLVVIDF